MIDALAETDIYSARRLILKEDDDFRPFSSSYLTYYVDKDMRSNGAAKGERKDQHHCHGFSTAQALRFMKIMEFERRMLEMLKKNSTVLMKSQNEILQTYTRLRKKWKFANQTT